jgi:hypothetical protein
LHGRPRYTKDLDIWIEVSPENAARIVTVLDEFGVASFGLVAEDFLDPDVVIQLGYEPNRVDFLTKLTGVELRTRIRAGRRSRSVISTWP